MGVPLQLIIGILLALTYSSTTNSANIRQIREAPPPSPAPIQNVTEINNRDLNKIIKDNSKTESVESKIKFVNNGHSYEELPLKLGKINDDIQSNRKKNITEETENSKEDLKKSTTKLVKEIHREESSRAIGGIDSSKFWSDDFHSKNVFTLPTAPDIETYQEPPDFSLEVTPHPSFEEHTALTTPTTKIYDQKFKETIESVEQNIENDSDDHEHQETDSQEGQNRDADLVEDQLTKHDTDLEFIKTKVIVNNETVDKNSIHKDINFEQTKRLDYENVFNDTKAYSEESTKGETSEQSSTERSSTSTTTIVFTPTTRKNSILKEAINEKGHSHLLSNNIEIETRKPLKDAITSTTSSSTTKDKGELMDLTITTPVISLEKITTESPSSTTPNTAALFTPLLKMNMFDQENHVVPLDFSSESTLLQKLSSKYPPITENSSALRTNDKQHHSIETRIAIDISTESYLTTEIITSTELPETTKFFYSTKEASDSTTVALPEEGTTSYIVENTTETSDATTPSSSEEDTTVILETTTNSGHRTSKSLENSLITEQMLRINEGTVENTTKEVDANIETTFRNELDSTTLNDGSKIRSKPTDNIIEIAKDTEETTTEQEDPTSIVTNSMVNVTNENVTKSFETTTIRKITGNIIEKVPETTSESILVNLTTPTEALKEVNTTDNIREIISDITAVTMLVNVTTPTEDLKEVNTTDNIRESISEITSETMLVNVTTQKVTKSSEATTKIPSTTSSEIEANSQREKSESTTTEYTFYHIEKTRNNHTTLLPELLSPNLNYSTTIAVDTEGNKARNINLDKQNENLSEGSSSSTTTSTSSTASSTTHEPTAHGSTTPDDSNETTENSFSKDSDGGDKGKIAAIAISSVGAVCLVILAGLLYVMKKRQKRLNYGPRCRPVSLADYSIDNLSVYNSVRRKGGARMSKRSFGNPAFDDPVAPTHPLNFPALAKFSSNFEDIKAEFEEIPQISARTSELPDGCETKNRYANVIPLPETRVFLQPIDGYPNSDYMNANYVTGPKNTKGYYIATQGPMQNTVDDFWRMIWEQQAKVILMLTHLVESGLEKCVDYLPESEIVDCSRLFGDFQIILKKQEVKDKYIISTLQLKNMVSNSWREVTHFWYLGWPEKGVPSEGNSLIAFLIEARSYMKTATIDKRDGVNGIHNGGAQNEHNPVIVHCSPGTGRTGVAIACDIAIREFETMRLVDIPKIVYRIRRDRAGAVQTKEQYTFIYKVVSLYATKLTGEALENF